MARHYCTDGYLDVKGLLDEQVHDTPDARVVNEFIEAAEARFDQGLSRFFAVPFDATESPQAFAVAKEITAKWAAAAYIRTLRQAEAEPAALWYANRIEEDANKRYEALKSRVEPADVTDAADPVVRRPFDGLTATDREPVFKRSNITPGDTHHW